MAKANRTCYCCGHEYYYCPSCPSDRKDPQIYTMWDSETCKEIFNTLVSESTKKITTKECKDKLVALGIDKIEINRDSVKRHIDKVMSYKEEIDEPMLETDRKVEKEAIEEMVEVLEVIEISNKPEQASVLEVIETIGTIADTEKVSTRRKKNSFKNKDN